MNRKDFLKAGLVMIGGVLVPRQDAATIIVRGPITPSGGSPAWVDSLDFSTTDNGSGGDANVMLWYGLTLTAGTASKLRCKITSYSSTGNIRMGLYNNAGSLLQSVVVSATANGTIEGTITNQAVTAANYFVSVACEDNGRQLFADLRASGSTNYNGSSAYASGAPASLPANDGPVTRTMAVGVYITP